MLHSYCTDVAQKMHRKYESTIKRTSHKHESDGSLVNGYRMKRAFSPKTKTVEDNFMRVLPNTQEL